MNGGEVIEQTTVDSALAALLDRHPEAVLVALNDSSLRVPVPDVPRFEGFSTLPDIESTVIDIVVPADRMVVVDVWERARHGGLAQGTIRTLSEPDRALTLAIIDARQAHGVWIGVLIPDDQWTSGDAESGLDGALLVSRRPRTAELKKNLYAIITDVDERFTLMLGWAPEQVLGHRSLEFIHPDDHERAIAQWIEMRSRKSSQRIRLRHRHQDGSWLWVEAENNFVGLDDPENLVAITHLTDISDEMAAHEALGKRERLFRRLAESLPAGLFQVDLDRTVVYANARLAQILGIPNASTMEEQLATVIAADQEKAESALAAALNGGTDSEVEVQVRLPDTGQLRQCLISVVSLSNEEGSPGAIVSITNVTDSVRLREELRFRATFDALTGCHNRSSTMTVLERILDQEAGEGVAVIFVDLNKFKPINDRHGHAVGDALLVEAAARLTSVLRQGDIVGRIGGDEFVLVCAGVTGSAKALALSERVRDRLHGTIELAGHHLELNGSIGVTLSTPGVTSDGLIAQADAAMYESKRHGGMVPVLFDGQPTKDPS